MGADIAAWAALKGFHVSLQDRAPEVLARAIKRAHGLFAERLKGRAAEAARDRLMPDMRGGALSGADLVIEAIIETAMPSRPCWRRSRRRYRSAPS